MPKLETTLEPIPFLNSGEISKCWTDICSALDFLHSNGFAYMDVKPSNICIDGDSFVLIDVGSVVEFGKRTSSTEVYFPSDYLERSRGNTLADWWMLATTLAEKVDMRLLPSGEVSAMEERPKRRTKRELLSFLESTVAVQVFQSLSEKLDCVGANAFRK